MTKMERKYIKKNIKCLKEKKIITVTTLKITILCNKCYNICSMSSI